jgi:carbonic anhydrase
MVNIDRFLQRNKDFAATGAHEGASIIARHQVYVITCLDPRTDPSAFLELDLGDAMVVRNAGGRSPPSSPSRPCTPARPASPHSQ